MDMRLTFRSFTLLLALAGVLLLGCDSESEATRAPEPETQPAQPTEVTEAEPADPAPEAEVTTATVGEPAPDFTLTDHAGTDHRLADLRGKVVVLEWINPECPFVQRHYEASTMRALAEEFADRGVVWLAIDSSHFVKADDSSAWRDQHSLPYPILQDPSGDVGRRYDATTTPNMFVIDAEGTLQYSGAIDDDPRGRSEAPRNYVREALQSVLEGQTPPSPETEPYGCTVKYEEA